MGALTDLVPELGAPKHLDRDRALLGHEVG
jgi:hypothetical protein